MSFKDNEEESSSFKLKKKQSEIVSEQSYDDLFNIFNNKKNHSISGMTLSAAFKLKKAENFNTWIEMIKNIAFEAGLIQYITLKLTLKKPEEVNIYNDTIPFEKWQAWVKWKISNARMANCITFNCQPIPQSIIEVKSTALIKWNALKQAYERIEIVIQQQELIKFVTIKYENYNDIQGYITDFQNVIIRLFKVMDSEKTILKYWPVMLFVSELKKKFSIWVNRQCTRQRKTNINTRFSLDALILNIQDETHQLKSNFTAVSETQALYSNCDNNRNNNKKNNKMTKKCLRCRQLNLKHIKENCLNTNKIKREK